MPHHGLDRTRLIMKPLAERQNKKSVAHDMVMADAPVPEFSGPRKALVEECAGRIKRALENDKPVMLAFGAHSIKNGLAPVLRRMMEKGWLTHLATNGAGIIHDWEFAFHGETSEDVRGNVSRGEFGNWQETGFYINLALIVGAYEGKGYGQSVGAMIAGGGLNLPEPAELKRAACEEMDSDADRAAAAADLLGVISKFDLKPGRMEIPHPHKNISVQAGAYDLDIPFTGHPMIGHDIIYNHPMNHGAAVGRCALRDFLTFAEGVSRIDGGVYMSVGSAVMSPMIFEKSLSMAQNLSRQRGESIDDHYIFVVDLAKSHWDWTKGEPPEDNPDYYLRFNKSFNRMGGRCRYLQADNRDFLLALSRELENPFGPKSSDRII